MIIECGACNSRFRLDESKITGRGARVRCRKCGEAITVMKDDADSQGGTGAAGPGEQEEGLDLRSILRESLEAPLTPAPPEAEPPGTDGLQSEFDKMMDDGRNEAGARRDAPPTVAPPRQQQTGGPTVDFGPEEELTFLQPGRQESQEVPPPGAAARKTTPVQPPPPSAPAPTSEFMMSTADSLDFLKADYDQEGQKAALDISGSLRIAPAPGADDAGVAPPLGTHAAPAGHGWPGAATSTDGQAPREPGWREPPGSGGAGAAATAPQAEPPSRSDAIRSELAGMGGAGAAGAGSAGTTAAPPRAKAAAPPPAPPLRESTVPKRSPAVGRAPGKTSASLKRGQGSQLVRPSVVLLLLLFFALAGGGAYLGFTSDGQKVLRGLVPQIESLWLGEGKPASRYEVGNLIGYYETTPAAGKMFIIKGQVTNEGRLRKVGVRVSAILLDAQNRNVAEKTVYAGNVLAGDAFRKAAREKIEAAMHNPIGGGLANVDLPPGKSVPFMVVFFDVPDGIDSYRLEPRDVD